MVSPGQVIGDGLTQSRECRGKDEHLIELPIGGEGHCFWGVPVLRAAPSVDSGGLHRGRGI